MDKKLLLIVNPYSGKGRMKIELLPVVEIFSNAGYEVTVYPTKARGDATLHVSRLREKSYDIIVVCGGDGTLNEVISGLMLAPLDCKIGYIPAGTLNEWSSGLNISRNILCAAKDVHKGKNITLDIGKFGDKYFTYTASFGAFTSASYTAPQNLKNVLGHAAYILEGIKSLGNIKPISLELICDDKKIEGDFLFGAVTNSMSVGGVVKFDSSSVDLNDGYFEVLLIRNPSNIFKLQPLIDGILKKELNKEGMEFFHAKRIVVKSDEKIAWTLDGEFAESNGSIVIENLHNAVNLIVPEINENEDRRK